MKRRFPLMPLTGAVLAFLLTASALACPVTGFGLNVPLGRVLWYVFWFTVFCALSLMWKAGALIPLSVLALGAGFLWRSGEIVDQLGTLLCTVTIRWHRAYGFAVLCSGADPAGAVELPLLAVGFGLSLLICWTFSRGKNNLYILSPTAALLIVCLVVTDTPPHPAALFGLLWAMALLLLTTGHRKADPEGGSRLLLKLALPVTLALGALFLVFPQERYVNRSAEIQETLLTLGERLTDLAEDAREEISGNGPAPGVQEQIDLSGLGPRTQWGYTVMRVTSPVTGTLYLRGQDYDVYTGLGWSATRHRSETLSGGGRELGQVTVRTVTVRDLRYVPYHCAGELTLVGGRLPNEDRADTYCFTLMERTPDTGSGTLPDIDFLAGSGEPWQDGSDNTTLPADTHNWARVLAREVTAGYTTRHNQAEAIADYVRSRADYDLRTGRMDRDSGDFAHWFLQEAETGYCVHFATAATVLLRGAGIPARYVEGYMVRTRAGEETAVTGKEAHAWAEYYAGGAWHVLEATPAAEDSPAPGADRPDAEAPVIQTLPPRQETTEGTKPETGIGIPVPREESGGKSFTLPGWLKALGRILPGLLLLGGQSAVRIAWAERLWNRGSPNERGLNRFRRCRRLARAAKTEIPEELQMLAQKAMFSPHTLTREELSRFDAFQKDCRRIIRGRSLPVRLWLGVVYGVR